jgi:pyruvate/2-oxoglutarate dehydrogenase complex dihydrolipoamide dehydrogenase (E3) component
MGGLTKYMETIHTNVLVLGSGTAGSNAARAASNAGAKRVILVQPRELINTCIEEGCMPSKSILAGSHAKESLSDVLTTRDTHIDRLKKALTDSFIDEEFEIIYGTAVFVDNNTLRVTDGDLQTLCSADSIVIATGSHPFVPPIPGLDTLGERLLISDDVVAKKAHFETVPKKILTIGGGPIGLELSTFFHDMGSEVQVLQRDKALGLFDPEFGDERVRASFDTSSFPIYLHANLTNTILTDEGVRCTIEKNGEVTEELFDAVLVATGRRSNLSSLLPENTDITLDERGAVIHDETMQTTVENI